MSQPTRADLLARYRNIGTGPAAAVSPPATVSPIHREVIALLDELLSFVPADAGPFGGLTKMLRRLEPALLRDFAKVPPDQVALFLRQLGERMMAVGGGTVASPAESAPLARQDQSQSA